jgi:putative heme-binding domain-containing protein
MHNALRGRKGVAAPEGWGRVYRQLSQLPAAEVREHATALGLSFGDEQALETLRSLALDREQPAELRRRSIDTLVEQQAKNLEPMLLALLQDPIVRVSTIRGLARYGASETPQRLIELFASLETEERQAAVSTLTSRPEYARQLLAALADKRIAITDVSPFDVRQMLRFEDSKINEGIRTIWGTARPFSEEKAEAFKKYKAILTPELLQSADAANGRKIFDKTCANCHRLFDSGRAVGPDLTGSQRTNVDYVLENLLDPNALVGREHLMTSILLQDGRLLTGVVSQENAKTLTLETATETVVLDKQDVEERKGSSTSLMPEGLLLNLADQEIRDLMKYLGGPQQVP